LYSDQGVSAYAYSQSSILTRSKAFRDLTEWTFKIIDFDKSGHVDRKEFYSGFLLIHLNLAKGFGPAACKPMSHEKVNELFDKMDADKSGYLCRQEFFNAMTVLCSQILSRVITQWCLTLLLLPFFSYYLIVFYKHATVRVEYFMNEIEIVTKLRDAIYAVMQLLSNYTIGNTPVLVKGTINKVLYALNKVPDSVWDSLPVTIISGIGGVILLPICISRIDSYFSGIIERWTQKKTSE